MYSLRDANNSDLEKLKEYKLATILDYANDISDDERKEIIDYVNMVIVKQLSEYKIIMCDDIDIGCLLVIEYEDGYLVDELYLDSDYRGKGIGSEILRDLINKYNILYLLVYKDNERAVRLYKKLGFKVIESTDFRYFMKYQD